MNQLDGDRLSTDAGAILCKVVLKNIFIRVQPLKTIHLPQLRVSRLYQLKFWILLHPFIFIALIALCTRYSLFSLFIIQPSISWNADNITLLVISLSLLRTSCIIPFLWQLIYISYVLHLPFVLNTIHKNVFYEIPFYNYYVSIFSSYLTSILNKYDPRYLDSCCVYPEIH